MTERNPRKPSGFGPLIQWTKRLFVVRVILYYVTAKGALLASGLAYQAIFAVFAAVWVGFSVVGLLVAGNHQLQAPLVNLLATSVPGLIKTSSGYGAIDPNMLLNPGAFTLTGVLALIGVLATALGWLASARTAIRIIFGIPPSTTNFLLVRLRDLGVAVGLGLALVLSAALSVAGSAATGFGLDLLGISPHSLQGNIVAKSVTIALSFVLDAAILGALFRVLTGVQIPWRRLVGGVIVGGVALGALKTLGGTLLGIPKSNPLLESFAVILGLLIFFNFVCQTILLSASWVSVALDDRGLSIGEMDHARRPRDPAADEPVVGAGVGAPQ